MLIPSSRFSKIVATGGRVPGKTHAPLTFPGTLSTAEHFDQSSAIGAPPSVYSNGKSSEPPYGCQHSGTPRATLATDAFDDRFQPGRLIFLAKVLQASLLSTFNFQ